MNLVAGLTTALCGVAVAFAVDRPMSSGERTAYILAYLAAGAAIALLVPTGIGDGRSFAIGVTSYLARFIGSQLGPWLEKLRVHQWARNQGL